MGHHKHHKNHKHEHHKEYKKPSKFLTNLKWFFIWVLIYFIFYFVFGFLLKELFGNLAFFKVKIIYFLLMGLFFSIFSRIVWCWMNKKHIYLGSDVFLFYTFAYAFSIWFGQFLSNLAVKYSNYEIFTKIIVNALIISIVVDLLIKLIKSIEFGFGRMRIGAPTQIMTGIILIAAGFLTFRFSEAIFVGWFKSYELMGWSWLIGLGLLLGGILTLVAWWRNNVLQHRIGIKFGPW